LQSERTISHLERTALSTGKSAGWSELSSANDLRLFHFGVNAITNRTTCIGTGLLLEIGRKDPEVFLLPNPMLVIVLAIGTTLGGAAQMLINDIDVVKSTKDKI